MKNFLMDSCQYKLTGTNTWEIDVQFSNCDQWKTCKKTLSITLGGFRVVAIGKTVTVNGVALNSSEGYINGRKLSGPEKNIRKCVVTMLIIYSHFSTYN